ncbi:unnamed protein product [Microthlaspi erraticum]|nr:unnamed protein product [Microthlaspi erraticum]
MRSRNSMNAIHFLEDEVGNRFELPQDIHAHCVHYFEGLLSGDQSQSSFVQDDITSLLDFSCSTSQRSQLDSCFSTEEIKEAFLSLPKNKTCGPDGFTPEFFNSCWTVVGGEVTAAIKEFFSSGKLLKQWNATNLVLIPKITNASRTTDFRPISCLNTMYKVISKLLAKKLKSVLPSVISHSQSAFLSGRMLSENVLLATEIVQGYNSANVSPRGMLKVDLRKAFDSVRWDFVLAVLKGLNMPDKFIGWISECLTTPCFSVSVNGVEGGFFKSSRGLKQGDPISTYLFVLVMEVFSKLLHSRFASGYISYHPRTHELNISHLMFADDVMIFFDGMSSSLHGIYETLDDFAGWSGLHMNREKTELFTAGTSHIESTAIANYGFPVGSFPIRYLGLPLTCRKLRISEYAPIVEKISKQFTTWSVRTLSFAGRLQLISSVIMGSVNFWCSTFILPKGCIKQIESLCSRFLWSGSIQLSRKAKVAWHTVCLPKSEGGLGLRRLSEWNQTLNLRLIRLLFSTSGSLWVAWHRYHNTSLANFWTQNENAGQSWTWRALLKLRPLAEKFLRCTIGNGKTASFWGDIWTPFGPLLNYLGINGPRDLRINILAKVSDVCDGVSWSVANPRSDRSMALCAYLTTIYLPLSQAVEDHYDWVIDGKSFEGFPTATTWDTLRPRATEKSWASQVWFKGATPRNAFTMWIATLNRLPVRTRLVSWGMQISPMCVLCSSHPESRDHLLLTCDFSSMIWEEVFRRLSPNRSLFLHWTELLSWTGDSSVPSPPILRKLVAHAAINLIWKQRNNLLHNAISISPSAIFKELDRHIINTINARRRQRNFESLMSHWLR